jgi:hypothetical protein
MCLPWGWLLLELDDCTWQSAHFSLVESLPPEASKMCECALPIVQVI